MSRRRGLTVVAGLAVAAAGLLSGGAWPVAIPVGAVRPQAAVPLLPTLEPVPPVHIDRLAGAPRPQPSSARDPFRFAERRQRPDPPAAHAALAAADTGAEAEAAPVRPELQLIGLAEDVVDGATVRTAVITAPNQVYLVREGEQIALRFLVDRIGADAVQLRDLSDDSTLVLTLR